MRFLLLCVVLCPVGCQAPHTSRVTFSVADQNNKMNYELSLDISGNYAKMIASPDNKTLLR